LDDGSGFNDVTKYDVYKSSSSTGPFTLLESVPATRSGSYTVLDTPVTDDEEFWYRVDTFDAESVTPSAVVGPASARDDLAPPPITTLTAQDVPGDRGGAIRLDWSGYVGPSDLERYNIYRATIGFTDVSAMTPLATLTDPSATEYIDNAAVNGVPYWYAVTGVDDVGNEDKSVTPAGPVQSVPNLSMTFPMGLSMIALPLVPANPDMGAILNIGGPVAIQLATYSPSINDYVVYAVDPTNPLLQQALGLRRVPPARLEHAGQPLQRGHSRPGQPDRHRGNQRESDYVQSERTYGQLRLGLRHLRGELSAGERVAALRGADRGGGAGLLLPLQRCRRLPLHAPDRGAAGE
jgi:hypothetical protein